MTTREILIAARKKIERPECWTKGAYARRADGTYVGDSGINEDGFISADAVCFCALGACRAVSGSLTDESPAARQIRDALGGRQYDLSAFNDAPTTTHADVLALFDRAIAACETP